ncbi:MAG: hypothetical protein ACYS9Y_00525 [Planctomycetota bacterium]|jgi:hypothetical protein
MDLRKNKFLWRFKWHIIITYLVLLALVLLLAFLTAGESESGLMSSLIGFVGGSLLLAVVIMILVKVFTIPEELRENSEKLEKVAGSLEKIRAALTQVNQNTRLGESAKSIAFRDADKQILREAVFDKLQQQDFDSTNEIIDEIAHSAGYRELAKQLRAEAERYRSATVAERENQVIAHIEKLLENHLWTKASSLIERLIAAYPDSEKAKAMRQKLFDKKSYRKKILLTAWDDAIKRQDTDRSLEILHELDLYLTANEGMALQEAARDVFRTKLHNLGVQFSFAVSERQWDKALEIGRQIVQDFPNSKMAQEIREKMDILKRRVEQQQPQK